MQTLTTIAYSPDEFAAFVTQLIKPLAEQISELKDRVATDQDYYSVQQIADRSAVSVDLVRDWIKLGRPVPGKNKKVKLRIADGLTDKNFRISREAWAEFRRHFPDVLATVHTSSTLSLKA